jgi:hypothetical protein
MERARIEPATSGLQSARSTETKGKEGRESVCTSHSFTHRRGSLPARSGAFPANELPKRKARSPGPRSLLRRAVSYLGTHVRGICDVGVVGHVVPEPC